MYTTCIFRGFRLKPNKKQLCRDDLVDRILTLDIEPGAILDESALCETYELSRTPLREVFQRLAGEGYVRLEENRSAKVSSMGFESMRNFFQAAPMIYAAIARLAAENASAAQIENLKAIQSSFRRNGEAADANQMVIYNHRFHKQIGDMAASPYLSPSLNRLLIDHARMSQRFYRPQNAHERELVWKACDQHDQMIEAIENREPSVAVQLTLDHWALSRDQIDRFVRPDPLPISPEQEADFESKSHAV